MENTSKLEAKLVALQSRTLALIIALIFFSTLGAAFSAYQITALYHQQQQQVILTRALCDTLERAGILVRGEESNPCEP